ncbi:hypothetical protein BYT27DRAFT_7208531 [Phlegmacium glaucopus]|nr:hypothetical protein BYT27DRAFT_7208531 [Phlegmacium glaucopus]
MSLVGQPIGLVPKCRFSCKSHRPRKPFSQTVTRKPIIPSTSSSRDIYWGNRRNSYLIYELPQSSTQHHHLTLATALFVNLLFRFFLLILQYPVLGISNQNTIECIGPRMNLVTPEFTPSTGFSTSECETCLWGSLTSPSVNSRPAGDDQELSKLCVKFRVLEARRAHHETHAKPQKMSS